MKKYSDYLTEAYNGKVYPFKIGIAGQIADDMADQLETALKKFGVQNCTPGKKTPIQERPLDFPALQNEEVTYYECEVTYPTHTEMLQEYLGYQLGIPQSHIVVRNPNEPQELYQEVDQGAPYETKLTKEEMSPADPSAQKEVGGSRVMDLLKELETASKESTARFSGKAIELPEEGATDKKQMDATADIGTKSPIGS
tara:strand:+ start:7652 stop:8245 length:594 start_codon:yes stop_codon:yes gene_type:complete